MSAVHARVTPSGGREIGDHDGKPAAGVKTPGMMERFARILRRTRGENSLLQGMLLLESLRVSDLERLARERGYVVTPKDRSPGAPLRMPAPSAADTVEDRLEQAERALRKIRRMADFPPNMEASPDVQLHAIKMLMKEMADIGLGMPPERSKSREWD